MMCVSIIRPAAERSTAFRSGVRASSVSFSLWPNTWPGRGVGSALLSAVKRWSVESDAVWLEVETQDTNVPACRFYERHGFEREGAVFPAAGVPHQTMRRAL